ncbi:MULTISPECIES: hypothetical protein [unclassified Rhizobium]|uniref:hypothetical protein n=1 Tax=unclassified Rhizobium TaxID=2613769 RepID=UPI001C82C3D6|nr:MULTISPECIES: hypothetical protein [unclassified Rhizobium]MBX5165806.1 hypothetical protein [Rhizobium sp. NZLR4b]MBX5209231.1 hypothetical protein [Rhizobium sp. NZLR11]
MADGISGWFLSLVQQAKVFNSVTGSFLTGVGAIGMIATNLAREPPAPIWHWDSVYGPCFAAGAVMIAVWEASKLQIRLKRESENAAKRNAEELSRVEAARKYTATAIANAAHLEKSEAEALLWLLQQETRRFRASSRNFILTSLLLKQIVRDTKFEEDLYSNDIFLVEPGLWEQRDAIADRLNKNGIKAPSDNILSHRPSWMA